MSCLHKLLFIAIVAGVLVLCIGLFPWYSPQEPHEGKGLYVFFGPTEDLWFNRIELNLTHSIPYRAFPDYQIFNRKEPTTLVRLDFRLATGPHPSPLGFVSPWAVRRISQSEFPRAWRFDNYKDFSLLYFLPPANYNDTVTLEFELDSSGLRSLSYFEFSAVIPFPPISQRVDVKDIEGKLQSLNREFLLVSVTTRFKVDERFSKDMPTFIEMDIPKGCVVREVYPFYSIGVAKDAPFITWDSRELKMLARGSYAASVMVMLEEPNLRKEYERRSFTSALLGGLFLSIPGTWVAQRILGEENSENTRREQMEKSTSNGAPQKGDSVPANDMLRREQVRATLAIGAIALAYYLTQVFKDDVLFTVPSLLRGILPETILVSQVSRLVIALFGLYVLATAVETSRGMLVIGSTEHNLWLQICELAHATAHLGYVLGAALLFCLGALVFLPIFVLAIIVVVADKAYKRFGKGIARAFTAIGEKSKDQFKSYIERKRKADTKS